MKTWFEIKVRAVLGPGVGDDKEVVILGWVIRWKPWGIEFEADPRHRQLLADYFGAGAYNGDKERERGRRRR